MLDENSEDRKYLGLIVRLGIEPDVPNKNGMVYPKEVLEKAVREFNEKRRSVPVSCGNTEREVGRADHIRKEDKDKYLVHVGLRARDSSSQIFLNFMESELIHNAVNGKSFSVSIAPAGRFVVDDDNVVEKLEIESFDLVLPPAEKNK
jgi:hypothetical protein